MNRGRASRSLNRDRLHSHDRPGGTGHEFDGRGIGNGKALYKECCASCHGAKLEGRPAELAEHRQGRDSAAAAARWTGHAWHHDNRLLFDCTRLGGQGSMEAKGIAGFKSGMPGLGDAMSNDEILDVLAYIRSAWPDRIREIQAARNPPHEQGPSTVPSGNHPKRDVHGTRL